MVNSQYYNLGQPFPNPSEGSISLPVMLPDGLPSGTFRLFDNMGRMLRSMPIDQQLQNLDFPPGSLVPGTYYYLIESGSYKSETKKIIIR